ncbi:hypothetical protein D3C75_1097960 [compost metagenome]
MLSLASRTASSSLSKALMASTGPKISSRARRLSLFTLPKIVGWMKLEEPLKVSCSPPLSSFAPSSLAWPIARMMRAVCSLSTIAPAVLAGLRGSPGIQACALAITRSMNSSWIERCTYSRELAEHTSP